MLAWLLIMCAMLAAGSLTPQEAEDALCCCKCSADEPIHGSKDGLDDCEDGVEDGCDDVGDGLEEIADCRCEGHGRVLSVWSWCVVVEWKQKLADDTLAHKCMLHVPNTSDVLDKRPPLRPDSQLPCTNEMYESVY